MELTTHQRTELRALADSPDVAEAVANRARIVLWYTENRPKKDIAALAGVSRPTVDRWLHRYTTEGVTGLLDRPRGAGRAQVQASVRARILALSRTSPPASTGLRAWSSREMSAYITRTEGTYVSHRYVAKLWRDNNIKPHRPRADPDFAGKVADVVGLYLDLPGGAAALFIDDQDHPLEPLPAMPFDPTEQRPPEDARHGTTNLFDALNVAPGEILSEHTPVPDGARFLAFLKNTVTSQKDKDLHIVLDNLAVHTTPEVTSWLAGHPPVRLHTTPPGSSWTSRIETWFGPVTRQSVRRGTFPAARVLISQIRDHIAHWNTDAMPFAWTATGPEILTKVRLVDPDGG